MLNSPPEDMAHLSIQKFIACGYIDEMGPLESQEIPTIEVDRVGDEVIGVDGDDDEWVFVIAWTEEDGRLLPTTMVMQSKTGKPVTRAVLKSIDIHDVIDVSRTREVQANADALAKMKYWKQSGYNVQDGVEFTPFAEKDVSRRRGRKPHSPEYYQRIAELWLATDNATNRSRKVAERLWTEKRRKIPTEDSDPTEISAWNSYRVQIRKAISEARKRGLIPIESKA